jgi:hypothetical protein
MFVVLLVLLLVLLVVRSAAARMWLAGEGHGMDAITSNRVSSIDRSSQQYHRL